MGYQMSSSLCMECHHYLIFYGLLFLGHGFRLEWTNFSVALFECAKLYEIHGICMGYKLSSGLCVECHHYLIFYGLLFLGLLL